jgi:ABC-2 type transport system ATP-binding protein
MITIKGLHKSYGRKHVLKGIDMNFERGMAYGIVGKNGAGKTTLFRCLVGLEQFEGEIQSELIPLKNHTGLLLTDPYFFSKMTGQEYVKLLCNARGRELNDLETKNIFDLPLNEFAETYSTGMKKKLAILALLLQGNTYFIFDEPFNGVDIQSNILLVELILKLKSLNKIVIISSHIFSTLSETCDQILVLSDGQIAKSVEPQEFAHLEAEMKALYIGNRLDALNLV